MIDLAAFADEIGIEGPVSVVGTSTREGAVEGARVVRAPSGIDTVNPAEMTVLCGAGTTLAELDAALAEVGQSLALAPSSFSPTMAVATGTAGEMVAEKVGEVGGEAVAGTIGGALALAASSVLRLGLGPARDTLLQARVVLADGVVVKAGGPTIKNVTGFDLCRLLVGSRGTLAALGEVLVRTRPTPLSRRWFHTADRDPWAVRRDLFRPSAILWDGTGTWVCLDGHPADVAEQAAGAQLAEVDGPPPLPTGARRTVAAADVCQAAALLNGPFVAEIGVGVLHLTAADDDGPSPLTDDSVATLNWRIKQQFDPNGRLNPGREPLTRHAVAEGSAR